MHNDPLKKFVQEHRDDFDELTPDAEIFGRLQNKWSALQHTTVPQKKLFSFRPSFLWGAAATLLIMLSVTFYLSVHQQDGKKNTIKSAPHLTSNKRNAPNTKDRETTAFISNGKEAKKTAKKLNRPVFNWEKCYADLIDSASASKRLAAILEIEKSNLMSYDLIHRLSKTLNNDGNSNVRLAALNVMSKYIQDREVMSTFMQSLSHQRDPAMQLAVMDLVSQMDDPKLDDHLYALVNDPDTYPVVKDQACFILLNQNKL
ncbi:hypothetical protein D9M68_574910 [compost metagenome]